MDSVSHRDDFMRIGRGANTESHQQGVTTFGRSLVSNDEKITREQLEGKFQALQDELQAKVADKKSSIATAIAIGGMVVVSLTYMLGRRRGRQRRSVVEIRRG